MNTEQQKIDLTHGKPFRSYGTAGGFVCSVHKTNSNDNSHYANAIGVTAGEAQVRAHFIACGPDIYEALKNLYNAIDSCIELTPEVLQEARAALTKAGGGTK